MQQYVLRFSHCVSTQQQPDRFSIYSHPFTQMMPVSFSSKRSLQADNPLCTDWLQLWSQHTWLVTHVWAVKEMSNTTAIRWGLRATHYYASMWVCVCMWALCVKQLDLSVYYEFSHLTSNYPWVILIAWPFRGEKKYLMRWNIDFLATCHYRVHTHLIKL